MSAEPTAAERTTSDAITASSEMLSADAARVADGVGSLADAADTAAAGLRQLEQQGLADYTHQLASYLSDMSARLRESNVDGLADDVQEIARRNPAMFVLGSVVVGLTLSRYAGASHAAKSDGEATKMRQQGEDATR